jgi:hypothetical protein
MRRAVAVVTLAVVGFAAASCAGRSTVAMLIPPARGVITGYVLCDCGGFVVIPPATTVPAKRIGGIPVAFGTKVVQVRLAMSGRVVASRQVFSGQEFHFAVLGGIYRLVVSGTDCHSQSVSLRPPRTVSANVVCLEA